MARNYDYINISTPRTRSPGLSHDLQLLRDLEIVNARTVSELGPLPQGGLPVVQKQKYVPPQLATLPEHGQTNFENQEDEAMKLSQIVAVTAVAAGIVACEISSTPSSTLVSPQESEASLNAADMLSQRGVEQTGKTELTFRDSYNQCAGHSTGVTSEIINCIAAEFEFQDARLNSVYQALTARLPEERKIILKNEQRDWIRKKRDECKWNPNTEGQGQLIDARSCELNLTVARAEELEKMVQVLFDKAGQS